MSFGEWSDLIDTAEGWHYGVDMQRREETTHFIQFVIDTVKATRLYAQLSPFEDD